MLANCGNVSTGRVSEVTPKDPAVFSGLPGASPSGAAVPARAPVPVKPVAPGREVRVWAPR
ncbi:hypothetical protein GCM10020295_63800 [Streptomyces cinereospinus]